MYEKYVLRLINVLKKKLHFSLLINQKNFEESLVTTFLGLHV